MSVAVGRTGSLPLSLGLVGVVSAVAEGVVVGCGVLLLLGVVDVVVGGGGGGGVDDVVVVLVGGWVRDVVERRTHPMPWHTKPAMQQPPPSSEGQAVSPRAQLLRVPPQVLPVAQHPTEPRPVSVME